MTILRICVHTEYCPPFLFFFFHFFPPLDF